MIRPRHPKSGIALAYIRLANAPARFDVSEDTLRRWEIKGFVKIYRRGSISLLKIAEVEAFIECGAKCGA